MQIRKVAERLEAKKMHLDVQDSALDFLSAKGFDPIFGCAPAASWQEKKRFFSDACHQVSEIGCGTAFENSSEMSSGVAATLFHKPGCEIGSPYPTVHIKQDQARPPFHLHPSSSAEMLQLRETRPPQIITETSRVELVLSGMQNRTFCPYLAAIYRLLISSLIFASACTIRARPVKRAVQQQLETALAKAILRGDFREEDTIWVEATDDGGDDASRLALTPIHAANGATSSQVDAVAAGV
jgi:C-terminal, D2-small domain, of ClpB protein